MTQEFAEAHRTPKGELVTRTLTMPGDTNASGDMFGGWLLSQMDIAGGIVAQQTSRSRVTTVAVDAMAFHCPVLVGDTVACYAHLEKIGRTSMSIGIEVWVQRHREGTEHCVTEGLFTYVALDPEGHPWPVKR